MRIFRDQPLASTNLDLQEERLTKDFLERFVARTVGTRFPIHQQHDMSKPVSGHIENTRLVPDPDQPGEWVLIGDVYVTNGAIGEVLKGFSISGTESIRYTETATAFLYLPYPHYNDKALLTELHADRELSTGKWIKKSAEPAAWALLGSAIAFAITPVWDDVYKRLIAPRIDALLASVVTKLQKKGVATELAQMIIFNNREVEVRIIPVHGKEEICLNSGAVASALTRLVSFLQTDPRALNVGVNRTVLFFDEGVGQYKLHRVEYADGQVEHLV